MRGKNCLNSFISFPDSDEGEEGALVSRNVRPNTCKANGGSDSFVPSSRRQNQVQDKTKFKTKPSSRRQNQSSRYPPKVMTSFMNSPLTSRLFRRRVTFCVLNEPKGGGGSFTNLRLRPRKLFFLPFPEVYCIAFLLNLIWLTIFMLHSREEILFRHHYPRKHILI